MRQDLQGARARDELFLLFQPIVSLEEQRVTGMEAQLRWRHPELGEVSPSEFLPVAERTGLIGELLRWALEETARTVAGLPDGEPTRCASGSRSRSPTSRRGRWSGTWSTRCALGPRPERLVLQINAPAVMSDDERTGLDVASLRLMGVHVALDGFGGGSSELAHLTRLPIDILRLDRSLISRIDRDPQSRALCESIVGIAPCAGARRRGRRGGDAGAAGRAVRLRVRLRPGLPDRPSAAAGRLPGAARRRRRRALAGAGRLAMITSHRVWPRTATLGVLGGAAVRRRVLQLAAPGVERPQRAGGTGAGHASSSPSRCCGTAGGSTRSRPRPGADSPRSPGCSRSAT